MTIADDPDNPEKITKKDLELVKTSMLEDGISFCDIEKIKENVGKEFDFTPEHVIMKPISDDELMYGIIGYNKCNDCDSRHLQGVVLDSEGNVIRRLKPEYAQRWLNEGNYLC